MNTHTAHYGLALQACAPRSTCRSARCRRLRVAPALPRPRPPGWLERLAIWSERQPMHHRLGSYNRYR